MKRKISLVVSVLLICVLFAFPVMADSPSDGFGYAGGVYDGAGLLTEDEFDDLSARLNEIDEQYGIRVVVVTVNGLDGKSAEAYADDFFDYNEYGSNGILYLVDMDSRQYHFSTTGSCITTFTDAGIRFLQNDTDIIKWLSEGDYYGSFVLFANYCDEFLNQEITYMPYDTNNMPSAANVSGNGVLGFDQEDKVAACVVFWIIGLIVALIVTLTMRGKLKTVRFNDSARAYENKSSLVITNSSDRFLYRNVSRVLRQSSSGGGGGSSTHIGSSGISHGGGGGHF